MGVLSKFKKKIHLAFFLVIEIVGNHFMLFKCIKMFFFVSMDSFQGSRG